MNASRTSCEPGAATGESPTFILHVGRIAWRLPLGKLAILFRESRTAGSGFGFLLQRHGGVALGFFLVPEGFVGTS